MALPTILINSATGSDTAASGAGPATALTGSNASFAAAVVTLNVATDLSGVATDGSHVLYLLTSTGVRFFKITAKNDGADQVTVTPNPAGTATGRTWAIGGKRASLGSASSLFLINVASASGDAMPGWILEMESGHTETNAAALDFWRAGDTTTGPITLRGTSGAATPPILTFSNNGNGLVMRANRWQCLDFELRNTNATKTASVGVIVLTGVVGIVLRVKAAHSTNKFWRNIQLNATLAHISLTQCDLGYAAEYNIYQVTAGSNVGLISISDCYIHDGGGGGFKQESDPYFGTWLIGNIFARNTGYGALLDNVRATLASCQIIGNTFDANTSDGLRIVSPEEWVQGAIFRNNIFSNNGGYGLNWVSATFTAAYLLGQGVQMENNDFYLNTSGKYNPSTLLTGLVSLGEQTLDPQFVDAANGDFTIGNASLLATGFPSSGVFGATRRSFVDPGAVQSASAEAGIAARQTIIQNIGTY